MFGSRPHGDLVRRFMRTFMRKLSVALAVCWGTLEVLALLRSRWVQHRVDHRAGRRALG
jgi:hypothetical protein